MPRRRRLAPQTSAEKVAFVRALAALEREAVARNPDHMAEDFLADFRPARISLGLAARSRRFHACCRWTFERAMPGAYWSEVARVRHFDEVLLERVSAGVEQVVVLGAGLDSRAYRFTGELEDVAVYELDQPTMSLHKRGCVERVLGELPARVAYVAADLTEATPAAALAEVGFDSAAPVFVLWSGVAPYLEAEVVAGVLGWVGGHPPGSSVVFDYFTKDFFVRPHLIRGVRRARYLVERDGERFRSGFDQGELVELLERCGLVLKSHLDPPAQEATYLGGDRYPGRRRPADYPRLAHAEVPAR